MPKNSRKTTVLGVRTKAILSLVAAILATIAAHLFQPSDWPPLGVEILHSLHGPGFAALAVGILWYLQRQCRSLINYVLAATIAMAIGFVSEIAQIPGARDAQFKDLVIDALGIVGGLGLVALFDKSIRQRLSQPQLILLPIISATALSIACVPTLWFSYALTQQRQTFPTLLEFEKTWERAAFGQTDNSRPTVIAAPENWPVGGNVAYAQESGKHGIFLSFHPPPNWQGYSQISFRAATYQRTFPMAFCIRDIRPDGEQNRNRFCKRLAIQPSPTEFTVTFEEIQSAMDSRPFDFSRVDAVVLSAARPGNGNDLLIDDIRLEE